MSMPSLFISHGSPTVMIEEDSPGREFLAGLGAALPKPKAILVISAHWETDKPKVTATLTPEIIYDFYGFPDEMYLMTYPAAGSPELAKRVADLVGAELDENRGLDHGVWSPLKLMYPDADIPVVQLSLQSNERSSYHYEIGRKLAPLRKEGVLIIASGAATHNLKDLQWYGTQADDWAVEFEDWFVDMIESNHHDGLLKVYEKAPHFDQAHPKDEHWLPIYVAMGAAQESANLLHRGFEHKNLSMASVRFD